MKKLTDTLNKYIFRNFLWKKEKKIIFLIAFYMNYKSCVKFFLK